MAENPLLNGPSSNHSENESDSVICPELEDWWKIVYSILPVYIDIICVIGIFGNVLVLFIYSFYKGSLKIAEIYLINLAMADLIFLMCLPFWAANIRNEFNWPFDNFLCRSTNAAISLNMYTSIYLLVAVSLDRYLIFVHTLSNRRIRSKTLAKGICLLIWLFGILVSIPTFAFRTVKHYPQWNISACTLDFPSPSWIVAERLVFNILGFALPSMAIIFLNFCIVHSLRENTREQRALRTKSCKDHRDTRATRLIFIVVLMFLLCWTPHHLFTFLDILFQMEVVKGCVWEELLNFGQQFTSTLAITNSCINPVIYVFVGKYFRQIALQVFSQLIPCRFSWSWESLKEKSISYFILFPVRSSLT
ncbi:PREDICTED: LOW QUALITY PROTEIN: B1 bradykinin receptor [Tinamus guttatus]|uniref:LOW QUALITY PROTEIN: B1 bradykinin receptor n=1 Tax=Tinamus guttatus TaxID=94827 RepID=UPI00052EA3D4|nr:PREDICTED: LOW QUALITY PROTEIN: B1 bradykinin receptor [Tinamus guttatus]